MEKDNYTITMFAGKPALLRELSEDEKRKRSINSHPLPNFLNKENFALSGFLQPGETITDIISRKEKILNQKIKQNDKLIKTNTATNK